MKHHTATLLAALALTGCGSSEQPPVEQIVVREPGQAAEAVSDAGDDLVAAGEAAFTVCAACHTAADGAPSGAGPNLYGVVGRQAGSLEGFSYSDAMAGADFVWDERQLNLYLADPNGTVPGTSMIAGAISDAERRASVIAYLATLTD